MRLATLRDGSRDGALVIVDRSGTRFASARQVAPNLQSALDRWESCEPGLRELERRLERGEEPGQLLQVKELLAPLPRAYEWVDGSAYLNHVVLVRKARGAAPPENLETDPLVYQGGSGVFLAPTEPLVWPNRDLGLDFEAEIAVVLGDVAISTTADQASACVRLVMLANDVTYRGLVPGELKKGFGFFVSKPATAFSPFAVTTDELGDSYQRGRVFLRLVCTYNGRVIGDSETGAEMHFSFFDLIAHIAQTRAFAAGTVLGSGTVSNKDPARGVSCLAEMRAREAIAAQTPVGAAAIAQTPVGASMTVPLTPFMGPGDRIRIEAFDQRGRSVFGAIDQTVGEGYAG